MKVELLYFDGCRNYEALAPRLRELLAGTPIQLELRRVASLEEAQAQRFLGSPTVRVNGRDIDPDAAIRDDFGLKCRLYATSDGLRGTPPEAWIQAALDATVEG